MSESKARASLSKGRQSWCIIFRHPLCLGPDGKQKLRIRRGLGTAERPSAQALVDQMNEILGNPTLWNLASRGAASQLYDERIVSAFYDPMLPVTFDSWGIREEFIRLPGGKSGSDGYARVLLVGTTGSGKTTITRQILGTDPESERFPSISAAKTTICDLELIFAEGPYRAVVTFIPRDRVRQLIAECVFAAVITKFDGSDKHDVIRRFLEHSEQRFRLSYILGSPIMLEKAAELELEDEDSDSISENPESNEIEESERISLLSTLNGYIEEIDSLEKKLKYELQKMASELGVQLNHAGREDREALQEMAEDQLTNMEEFHQFVDMILDDVESRFDLLTKGETSRGRDGWPVKWTHSDANRSDFIKLINKFSSNYAPNFGRLLTPLVDGIRVSGPFRPTWDDKAVPKLALMDGQGIGHTADSTSSISTSITSRFHISDAIILVDNAAQPMQAGTCAVLQSLVISGHESKLILAFTHFDEVTGDNFRGTADKKDHILSSFDNAISAIGKSHGREAESALRNLIPERVVFLSNIQNRIGKGARLTLSEMKKLLDIIKSSIIPLGPIDYKPIYDVANLVLAVQKASQEFHDRWKGVLGFGSVSSTKPEHWTRVKALARRLGIFKVDEYDTLRPVADLIRLLQMHMSQFLSCPLSWAPQQPPEDSKDRIDSIDAIKKEVFTRLHDLSKRRILEARVREWIVAYEHRGIGSTRIRARDLVRIYEDAAPIPNEMPGPDANHFLFELRAIISESINEGGGIIIGVPDKAIEERVL